MAMEFAMMPAAKGYGELVTDLTPERPALRKAQVMRIRGLPATNEAWLLRHISDVVAISDPPRHR